MFDHLLRDQALKHDSRYLRARKFDVQGAIGQFTDTEKWLKEQRVEELYENFDVEFYEKARAMVSIQQHYPAHRANLPSTRNGPVVETNEESQSTFT